AVAERAPGHVPDHLPHEHFEFFRIDVHSSLHFLAERLAQQRPPSNPSNVKKPVAGGRLLERRVRPGRTTDHGVPGEPLNACSAASNILPYIIRIWIFSLNAAHGERKIANSWSPRTFSLVNSRSASCLICVTRRRNGRNCSGSVTSICSNSTVSVRAMKS